MSTLSMIEENMISQAEANDLIGAIELQRNVALNNEAQLRAALAKRDREIAELKAQIEAHKSAADAPVAE